MTIQRSNYISGEVLENRVWSKGLHSLIVSTEQLPFKAGQFVRLQLSVDGQKLAKSYSLVNAPGESVVEVFFNRVPEGRLSNALASLEVGDSVEISQPANGFFVLDEIPDCRDLWMIATGTGLGPYISILKTADLWDRFENVVLVHGVSRTAELAYSEQIEFFLQQNPARFSFLSCVTREPNPGGLHGRITDLLASGELEKSVDCRIDKERSHIMLCGNHSMIVDMKELLAKHGLRKHLRHKPGQITTEQYF